MMSSVLLSGVDHAFPCQLRSNKHIPGAYCVGIERIVVVGIWGFVRGALTATILPKISCNTFGSFSVLHVGPDPNRPQPCNPNANPNANTNLLPFGGREVGQQSCGSGPCFGGVFAKKNAQADRPASANQTAVLHELIWKVVLQLGALVVLYQ